MIEIHGRKIGEGQPAYIVAEIGINHNGNVKLAQEMIQAAASAGCDAVKFQYYKTDSFIGQRSEFLDYTLMDGTPVRERQEDLFRRCELSLENMKSLKKEADRSGIHFHATPMDPDGVWDLVDLGVGVMKNGSDCLQNYELIQTMAEAQLPTVMSTGMATRQDINRAVYLYHEATGEDIILLHCTSAYPCADLDANLRKINGLREGFFTPVGFSDHTRGWLAAALSVAYGAVWIEKHFTTDHNLPGPDQWFSADPEEMRELVHMVRRSEAMAGKPDLEMTETEKKNREKWFR